MDKIVSRADNRKKTKNIFSPQLLLNQWSYVTSSLFEWSRAIMALLFYYMERKWKNKMS